VAEAGDLADQLRPVGNFLAMLAGWGEKKKQRDSHFHPDEMKASAKGGVPFFLVLCFGAITANCMGGTQFLPAFPAPPPFCLVCVLVFHLICCVCVCVWVHGYGKRNKSIKVHTHTPTQKHPLAALGRFSFSCHIQRLFSSLPIFFPTHFSPILCVVFSLACHFQRMTVA